MALAGCLILLSTTLTRAEDGKSVFDHFLLDAPDSKQPRPNDSDPPPVVDLRKFQTSIKNQGGRDSCPYFPPVAALEAAYGRKGIHVELSTEHLIWLRNVTAGSDKGNPDIAENLYSMVGGGNGMEVLRHYAISRKQDMPYHTSEPDPAKKVFGVDKYDWSKPFNQFVLNRWNLDPGLLTPAARANAKYAIDEYVSLPRSDLNNPRKFEEILAAGHEIIFAINLHKNSDDSASGQPVWRLKPNTPGDSINHFMLMVGYDRPRQFFIVKNQWGPTKFTANKLASGWHDVVKYHGFTLVDYNYLATCAEAHYITKPAGVGDARFTAQRALGQWLVTFKRHDTEIMRGVLAWRRLPDSQTGMKSPDLRIGDLVTTDGKQYRVNAELSGDGKKAFDAKIFIDFKTGALPADSRNGLTLSGALNVPEKGEHSMELQVSGGTKDELWDGPASEIHAHATLIENRNLLLTMKQPGQNGS